MLNGPVLIYLSMHRNEMITARNFEIYRLNEGDIIAPHWQHFKGE